MAIYFKDGEKERESRWHCGMMNAHILQKEQEKPFFDILEQRKGGDENLEGSRKLSIFDREEDFPSTIQQNKD